MNAFIRLLILSALSLAACGVQAQAQNYPTKVVRIIVPFPPGGPTDVISRAIAQTLNKFWNQPVVIENRPGANTIIGADYVAKASPDGYTILLASGSTLTMNMYVYAKLPYDPVRDFAPVINLVKSVPVFVASPTLTADTLQDFIALAKAKPGELAHGYFSPGEHLLTKDFSARVGIQLNYIPYKGAADVVPALMASQIQVAFMSTQPAMPHIRSGKLKALAYAGMQRATLLPNVPTLMEIAGPDLELSTSFGLVVPAATPRAIVNKIAADVSRIILTADFDKQFVAGAGLELFNMGPDQYVEYLTKDRALWAVRAKAGNLKPE